MTPIPAIFAPTHPRLQALAVVMRAASGLFAHGLTRPFAPVAIDPHTGRVVSR